MACRLASILVVAAMAVAMPTAPGSVDWRKCCVTPVANQSLSVAEVVDCAFQGACGCSGGFLQTPIKWIEQNGGLDSAADFPSKSCGVCNQTYAKTHVVARVSGFEFVKAGSDAALAAAVAKQPVAVPIDASSFETYSGGIFAGPCTSNPDHAMLVVGYGSEGGESYYILKNSWGTAWGESGYMRLKRTASGLCGILTSPFYPVAGNTTATL